MCAGRARVGRWPRSRIHFSRSKKKTLKKASRTVQAAALAAAGGAGIQISSASSMSLSRARPAPHRPLCPSSPILRRALKLLLSRLVSCSHLSICRRLFSHSFDKIQNRPHSPLSHPRSRAPHPLPPWRPPPSANQRILLALTFSLSLASISRSSIECAHFYFLKIQRSTSTVSHCLSPPSLHYCTLPPLPSATAVSFSHSLALSALRLSTGFRPSARIFIF